MKDRILGSSSVRISPLGLGTRAMAGLPDGWGYANDNESIAAIRRAVESGVKLVCTTPRYANGHCEDLVRKALGDLRDHVALATGCGLLPPHRPGGTPRRCLAPESIRKECETSRRRLGTDVIDLYVCHWPDPETPIGETMTELTRMLDLGWIRAIGVAHFSCEQIAAALEHGPIHCVQAPFSMLHRRPAENLIPFCKSHDIAFLACSPLACGLLTGRFNRQTPLAPARAGDPLFSGSQFETNLARIERMTTLGRELGRTPAQLALQWTFGYPGVTSAIAGARRVSQVMENMVSLEQTLTAQQRERVDLVLDDADDPDA